ncbi:sigma factor-like helix-turn-helix DNA-binding protein [Streptomyces sp. NPDC007369]|uniref:sigma factor-like helix-turn-helix DNA-binding protein n=1 Tax=Streptomyces sp. NPDC007369 TaxID=3154589 RepID=UPI0033E5CE84
MTVPSAPRDVPRDRRGKRGRRLGPIADGTGAAHRAWLEPLRDAFHGSGLTLDELQARTGWPKSHISELLRAVERYPRWAFVRTVLTVLKPRVSYEAMRLRWVLAARDAGKRTSWIKDCLHEAGGAGARAVAAAGPVPLDYLAFQEMHRPHYARYAAAFLRRPALVEKAVGDVFTLLLLLWHDALASENPERFAWPILRQTVLEHAPKENGRPSLALAAFDTVALDTAPDPVGQVEETMALFRAVAELAPVQRDVVVLLHLCGLEDTQVADELGVSLASVRSTARHARRNLDSVLHPITTAEEGHPRGLDH